MARTRYAGEKLDADGFKEIFGLSSVAEEDAYSKGSSTGTKQVAALGTYMTEDDYNRLKDDDAVWDAYAQINGESAMRAKKKSNKGGLSINALDGLMDDLSADPDEAGTPAPETKDTFTYSDKVAKAKAGEKAFEDVILPHQGDYIMGRKKTNPSDDYLEAYKLNLTDFRKERNRDGSLYDPEQEAAAVAGTDVAI